MLLKLLPGDEKAGLIHIPNEAFKARRSYKAEVLAAGPDCVEVHGGDIVYIGNFAGQMVDLDDGEDYLVVYEGEIPAVVTRW